VNEVLLEASKLKKNFDRRTIFRDLHLSLKNGDSLAVTGKNGSGKSTLIKILSNIILQTAGTLSLTLNGKNIERQFFHKYVGLASPYLNMYDEFTGLENLRFVARLRSLDEESINLSLSRVGLWDRRNDLVKIYSSGMKQRLKIAFALMHQPEILLLDEPTSNLDSEGVNLINIVAEEYKSDKLLIIATNDEHERSLCEKELNLDTLKKEQGNKG
jgi:heme exporter protein A